MTDTPRTMSEKRRAFLALCGNTYPRAGDVVWWDPALATHDRSLSLVPVEVERISRSGSSIWTRFRNREWQQSYGGGLYRWALSSTLQGQSVVYRSTSYLRGSVTFYQSQDVMSREVIWYQAELPQ